MYFKDVFKEILLMSFIWDNFERTDLDIVQSGIIFHKIVTVMLST